MTLVASLAAASACVGEPTRQQAVSASTTRVPAAQYDGDQLVRPAGYRDWTFLTSGIDMSYSEAAQGMTMGHSTFDNVFADPAAYRAFVDTGRWPEGTMLLIEVRGAATRGSINKAGHFQTRDVMGLEVHVKDRARFAATGGWAFFSFESGPLGALIPPTADCFACHRDHALVDTTFVQFYPTLLEIAERKGTAKGGAREGP